MAKTAEAPTASKYQTLAFASIPKRATPGRSWDHDEANALLSVVTGDQVDGSAPTATDGAAYADQNAASAARNRAKRLLAHVLPDGMVIKSVIFGLDANGVPVLASDSAGTYGWAVWLAIAPAEKPAATAE